MAQQVASAVQYSVFTSILVSGGIAFLMFFVYRFLRERKRTYPPGPPGLPVFGNIFSLLFTKRQQHEVIFDWTNQYGPIFSFKMLNTRVYILSDVGLVQEAFHRNPDISDRMSFAISDATTGRQNSGVAFANGAVWKEQSRFLKTVFKKVDSGVVRFDEIIGSQAQQLIAEVEKQKGASFDPWMLVNISVANIISRIITGVSYHHDDPELRHLIKCSCRIFDLSGVAGMLSLVPILSKFPSSTKTEVIHLYNESISSINKSIDTHKTDLNVNKPPTDFIGCYLAEIAERSATNNTGSFDEINLKVTCNDALVAGWETTTTSLLWVLFTLATHPDAQDRVREEIRAVIGDDRLPAYSDRHTMPITAATTSECMRLRPVAAIQFPHIASRDCKLGGFDIPKGSLVTANMWYLALSPNLWDQPEEFRPDRFLDDNGAFNKKLEPIPFGYGRRSCPGENLARMEIFLFTTYILQHFTIRLPEGAPRNNCGKHGITNRPNPFMIQAVKNSLST